MIYDIVKRFIDILFSLLAILLLSPVLLVLSLVIYFDSPGHVIYFGKRTGLNAKSFSIFKFRTMVINAESLGGPSTALNDTRLTKTGRFLRKYKLDELPQLFNVLFGTMSFVGPRPQVEQYTKLYNEEEQRIFTVKPGLTDFASIYFIDMDHVLGTENVDEIYKNEIEPKKNKLRLKYVYEKSFLTDMKLLFLTFILLIGAKNLCNIETFQKTN